MNLHSAILRAAAHIEQHPKLFDYYQNDIPPDCGTPACALGWISHFRKQKVESAVESEKIVGFEFFNFTAAMDNSEFAAVGPVYGIDRGWRWNASDCAATLRHFSKKFEAEADAFQPWLASLMSKIEAAPIQAEA